MTEKLIVIGLLFILLVLFVRWMRQRDERERILRDWHRKNAQEHINYVARTKSYYKSHTRRKK